MKLERRSQETSTRGRRKVVVLIGQLAVCLWVLAVAVNGRTKATIRQPSVSNHCRQRLGRKFSRHRQEELL